MTGESCSCGRCRSPLGLVITASLLAGLILSAQPGLAQSVRPITLRQAVQLALKQNPDAALARIEALKASHGAVEARAAFSASVYAGSGLGYTDGIPQSIEGANPSIVQITARRPLYDRSLLRQIRAADEDAQAASFRAASQEDEIAFQVATTFLDFESERRRVGLITEQAERLGRAEAAVAARVEEGREIDLSLTRARLEKARAERRLAEASSRERLLETTLRAQIGIVEDIVLEPRREELALAGRMPESAAAGARRTLANSPELKSLAAQVRARDQGVEVARGALYPKLDVIAQYSMLSRFNNFEKFFNDFQRHNFQVGISLQAPIYAGKSVSSRIERARIEAREAELRHASRRSSLAIESLRLYQRVEEADGLFRLAKMELDYSRESLDVFLAEYEEGRIALDQLERARAEESIAWEAYYRSLYILEKARLNVLRRSGELAAALD